MPVAPKVAASWKAAHKLADDVAPDVAAAWTAAVVKAETIAAPLREAILADLNKGNTKAAVRRVFQAWQKGSGDFRQAAGKLLGPIVAESTKNALEPHVGFDFKTMNPRAHEWAQEYAGELVTLMDEHQKHALRQIISDGFTQGLTRRDISRRLIYDGLGLNARQAASLGKYQLQLQAAGVGKETLIRKTQRHRDKLLRQRATMIARTETMRASNMGVQLGLEARIAKGALDPAKARKIWIVTHDDRTCPYCFALEGQLQPVHAPFVSETHGTTLVPPIHPLCRCAIADPPPGAKSHEPLPQPLSKKWVKVEDALATGNKNALTGAVFRFNKVAKQHGFETTTVKKVQQGWKPVGKALPEGQVPVENIATWTQIGDQAGSTPGGMFRAPDGSKWYVKYQDIDHIANEQTAYDLYRAAGLKVPDVKLVHRPGGGTASASRIIDGLTDSGVNPKHLDGTLEGFGMDAWMANWDSVGIGTTKYDNILNLNGKAVRVDAGGALLYRGTGGAKGNLFDDLVSEWTGLRDPSINPVAASVYGNITDDVLRTAAQKVTAFTDDQIRTIVMARWTHAPDTGEKLVAKLIARREAIRKHADDIPKPAPAPVVEPPPAPAPAAALTPEEAWPAVKAADSSADYEGWQQALATFAKAVDDAGFEQVDSLAIALAKQNDTFPKLKPKAAPGLTAMPAGTQQAWDDFAASVKAVDGGVNAETLKAHKALNDTLKAAGYEPVPLTKAVQAVNAGDLPKLKAVPGAKPAPAPAPAPAAPPPAAVTELPPELASKWAKVEKAVLGGGTKGQQAGAMKRYNDAAKKHGFPTTTVKQVKEGWKPTAKPAPGTPAAVKTADIDQLWDETGSLELELEKLITDAGVDAGSNELLIAAKAAQDKLFKYSSVGDSAWTPKLFNEAQVDVADFKKAVAAAKAGPVMDEATKVVFAQAVEEVETVSKTLYQAPLAKQTIDALDADIQKAMGAFAKKPKGLAEAEALNDALDAAQKAISDLGLPPAPPGTSAASATEWMRLLKASGKLDADPTDAGFDDMIAALNKYSDARVKAGKSAFGPGDLHDWRLTHSDWGNVSPKVQIDAAKNKWVDTLDQVLAHTDTATGDALVEPVIVALKALDEIPLPSTLKKFEDAVDAVQAKLPAPAAPPAAPTNAVLSAWDDLAKKYDDDGWIDAPALKKLNDALEEAGKPPVSSAVAIDHLSAGVKPTFLDDATVAVPDALFDEILDLGDEIPTLKQTLDVPLAVFDDIDETYKRLTKLADIPNEAWTAAKVDEVKAAFEKLKAKVAAAKAPPPGAAPLTADAVGEASHVGNAFNAKLTKAFDDDLIPTNVLADLDAEVSGALNTVLTTKTQAALDDFNAVVAKAQAKLNELMAPPAAPTLPPLAANMPPDLAAKWDKVIQVVSTGGTKGQLTGAVFRYNKLAEKHGFPKTTVKKVQDAWKQATGPTPPPAAPAPVMTEAKIAQTKADAKAVLKQLVEADDAIDDAVTNAAIDSYNAFVANPTVAAADDLKAAIVKAQAKLDEIAQPPGGAAAAYPDPDSIKSKIQDLNADPQALESIPGTFADDLFEAWDDLLANPTNTNIAKAQAAAKAIDDEAKAWGSYYQAQIKYNIDGGAADFNAKTAALAKYNEVIESAGYKPITLDEAIDALDQGVPPVLVKKAPVATTGDEALDAAWEKFYGHDGPGYSGWDEALETYNDALAKAGYHKVHAGEAIDALDFGKPPTLVKVAPDVKLPAPVKKAWDDLKEAETGITSIDDMHAAVDEFNDALAVAGYKKLDYQDVSDALADAKLPKVVKAPPPAPGAVAPADVVKAKKSAEAALKKVGDAGHVADVSEIGDLYNAVVANPTKAAVDKLNDYVGKALAKIDAPKPIPTAAPPTTKIPPELAAKWAKVETALASGNPNSITGAVFRYNKLAEKKGFPKTTVKKVKEGWKPDLPQTVPGAQPPAPPPAPTPTVAPPKKKFDTKPDAPLKFDSKWEKIGGQGGSNPGGTYRAPDGTKYYVKWPADKAHAQNEMLAAKLYEKLGINAPEIRLVDGVGGKVGIASKIIDDLQNAGTDIRKAAGAQEGFVADAWLANWDVVGASYDNLLMKGGKAYRVDTGGALLYRAQGGLKGTKFGNVVDELDSLRKTSVNAQSASVFGNITDAMLTQGAKKIAALTDDEIMALVHKHGPGTYTERIKLANKLIARRDDIAKRILKQEVPGAGVKPPKGLAAGQSLVDAQVQVDGFLADVQKLSQTYDLPYHEGTALTKPLTNALWQAYADPDDAAAIRNVYRKLKLAKDRYEEKRAALGPAAGIWPLDDDAMRELPNRDDSVFKERFNDWLNELPTQQRQAVTRYTGNFAYQLNEEMRHGDFDSHKAAIQKIRAALAKAPKPPPPELVWRSIRSAHNFKKYAFDPDALDPGSVVDMKGFTSTTVKPGAYGAGGDYMFEIKPKSGGYIRPISQLSNEFEYLITDGKEYKFLGKKQVPWADGYGQRQTVYQFEEI